MESRLRSSMMTRSAASIRPLSWPHQPSFCELLPHNGNISVTDPQCEHADRPTPASTLDRGLSPPLCEHRYPYVQRRPDAPPVPFLSLQGRRLHQAGFAIGTPVRVLVTLGRLVLEVDAEAE
jgi:Toxin SymE, type I toxin-antitoxin system